MTDKLPLCDEAQEYLAKFCAERNLGRSGKLQWDSFLLYTYKTHMHPPAVDLHAWLLEHLDNPSDVEELTQDYQRIGSIVSRMEELVVKHRFIPPDLKTHHQELLQEIAKPPCAGGLPLGYLKEESPEQNGAPLCSLPQARRSENPHFLLLGSKQMGKSRLMTQMLMHDIKSGDRSVVAFDTDGELTDSIDRWLDSQPNAADLARRIIRIDPASADKLVAYNPLAFPEDGDLHGAASAVVSGFKAIYTEPPGAQSQWNAQTANILRNAVLLLMANRKTLSDLPLLLTDNDVRDLLLENVERMKGERAEYVSLLDTWAQYKRLARTDQWIIWVEPILNRIAPALGDPRIRSILAKPGSDLALRDIILDKKVLIAKISRRQFDQTGMLLGSLLITGLKQAASSLWLNGKTQDGMVALYIDRLDHLIDNETLGAITDGTSKFNIGLVAGARHASIFERNSEARSNPAVADSCSQLLTSFGNIAVFAIDEADAQLLAAKIFPLDSTALTLGYRCASDQEKLNAELLVRQEPGDYFWWLVNTVGGVLHLRSPEQQLALTP